MRPLVVTTSSFIAHLLRMIGLRVSDTKHVIKYIFSFKPYADAFQQVLGCYSAIFCLFSQHGEMYPPNLFAIDLIS